MAPLVKDAARGPGRAVHGAGSLRLGRVHQPVHRQPLHNARRPRHLARAVDGQQQREPDPEHQQQAEADLKDKFFAAPGPQEPPKQILQPSSSSDSPQRSPAAAELSLDIVNPVVLGRQARQAFDSLWTNLSNLTSPTKSFNMDDVFETYADRSQATVLVTGATGRVGKVLIRKLLLRGYKVKALVRNRASRPEEPLPAAVEVVVGDVGEYKDCREAVRKVDKVGGWITKAGPASMHG